MKANELMIGDWVKPNNVDSYFKVGLISADSIWNDTDTAEWDLDEIEPIPLTAEILEKNGFKRFGTDYILKDRHFGLSNPSIPSNYLDNYWLRVSIKVVHIEYVHQLQHALRLCGIDKTIEL